MSEEQLKHRETEVAVQRKRFVGTDELSDDAGDDEVEAHSLRLEVMRKD